MELYIIIAVIIVLFIVALVFEFKDLNKLYLRPPAYLYDNLEEREKEYKFYGCYSMFVDVVWRMSFIVAFTIAVFTYALSYMLLNKKLSFKEFLLIFIVSFILIYVGNTFRNYHFHRDLCSKFNSDIIDPGKKMVILK